MTEHSFSLVPFPALDIPNITIRGKISRQNNVLAVRYSLAGNVEEISMPPRSIHPRRKDELWECTCFEFFLAVKDQSQYWEFNLSPSGDWNVYRMDAYRRIGFRDETAISQLPFQIRNESQRYLLDVAVDLICFVEPQQELQIAITAILETKNGNETYWALTHPAQHPDFHLRESFILRLAGQTHLSRQSAPGD